MEGFEGNTLGIDVHYVGNAIDSGKASINGETHAASEGTPGCLVDACMHKHASLANRYNVPD